ncbi:MAG: beta-N-acetylhexosaminidase, partial [Spirochaetales bacterium]|nr:beta-N-acetylhexosaminidase [Spirochaetales bacterium]
MNKHQSTKASELFFPVPLSIEDKEGFFRLHTTTTISAEPPFEEIADLASSIFGCKIGGEDLLFKYQADIKEEAYRLSVTKDQIVIRASSPKGAFYGLSAVRRLALLGDNIIGACIVEDAPSFEWRGFMLDCV